MNEQEDNYIEEEELEDEDYEAFYEAKRVQLEEDKAMMRGDKS